MGIQYTLFIDCLLLLIAFFALSMSNSFSVSFLSAPPQPSATRIVGSMDNFSYAASLLEEGLHVRGWDQDVLISFDEGGLVISFPYDFSQVAQNHPSLSVREVEIFLFLVQFFANFGCKISILLAEDHNAPVKFMQWAEYFRTLLGPNERFVNFIFNQEKHVHNSLKFLVMHRMSQKKVMP